MIQGQVFEDAELSPGMYAACKEGARAFESFGVWTTGAATVTGTGDPEQLVTVTATQGVLPALGVPAHIGRWFSEEDDTPGSPGNRDPQLRILAAEVRRRPRSSWPHDYRRFHSAAGDRRDAAGLSIRGPRRPTFCCRSAFRKAVRPDEFSYNGHRKAQAGRYDRAGESGCRACLEGMGRTGGDGQNARDAPCQTQLASAEDRMWWAMWAPSSKC